MEFLRGYAKPRLSFALQYGCKTHIITHMKKTIELDEKKVRNIMRLRGMKTQREAVEFALAHGERIAKAMNVFESDFFITDEPVIDSSYDLMKIRESEVPRRKGGRTN